MKPSKKMNKKTIEKKNLIYIEDTHILGSCTRDVVSY